MNSHKMSKFVKIFSLKSFFLYGMHTQVILSILSSHVSMFTQVIWKKLYKTRSGMERGTLYQLRNLINRRNVVTSCKDDMNACEEFFELVVNGYIITAVLDFLGMSSVIDLPLPTLVPSDAWMLSDADRRSIVMDTASEVVQQHVDLSIQFADGKKHKEPDTVYAYASELLSLGLLYFEFKDAVKEGDGD